ncbi:hypothetical protein O6H91_Y500700 [Diphasiastrum complanatum]|nr:hypothetical protein O6H91_Y500700 [Diphasiastrum complanatum]
MLWFAPPLSFSLSLSLSLSPDSRSLRLQMIRRPSHTSARFHNLALICRKSSDTNQQKLLPIRIVCCSRTFWIGIKGWISFLDHLLEITDRSLSLSSLSLSLSFSPKKSLVTSRVS